VLAVDRREPADHRRQFTAPGFTRARNLKEWVWLFHRKINRFTGDGHLA
jgi:hypothetical protein